MHNYNYKNVSQLFFDSYIEYNKIPLLLKAFRFGYRHTFDKIRNTLSRKKDESCRGSDDE